MCTEEQQKEINLHFKELADKKAAEEAEAAAQKAAAKSSQV